MINSYSVFSSFYNLRGIVRRAKLEQRANSVATEKSKSRVVADSSSKIFHANKVALYFFLLLHITAELWAMAVCGSKTAGIHVSQPMNRERVLAVRCLVVNYFFCLFLVTFKESVSMKKYIISVLKSQFEFWSYANDKPFFGLKLKYAIWILLLGYLGCLVLILRLVLFYLGFL